MRRESWLALLTLLWVFGALAALIRSEPPRGRVLGKVVAAETGQALAEVTVWFQNPKGEWKAVSKEDGSFELPNLPVGTYTITASAYAHRLEPTPLTLREGEMRTLLLALEPVEPFLELIHPQTVFHPLEAIKVGVRGFVSVDELRVQIWKVTWQRELSTEVPLTKLLPLLEEVRWGWWQGSETLRDALRTIAPCLTSVSDTVVPITQRDAEGVFLQFVPLPLAEDGIYLVRFSAAEVERVGLVIRTRLGLVVKLGRNHQDEPTVVAYVADLKSGKPVKGVRVTAWAQQRRGGQERDLQVGAGVTNADGLSVFNLAPKTISAADHLFVVASTNGLAPVAWAAIADYELEEAVQSSASHAGVIYTERPVYRPGNTVHFKGLVRRWSESGYQLPTQTLWTLLVRDPDDNIVHRTTVMVNEFGSFSGSLKLNEEAPTGTYTLVAFPEKVDEGNGAVTGAFAVAAYRKPEVQVIVKPTRYRFTQRDTVRVEVTARYYFGLPVAGAKVSYWVTRVPLAGREEIAQWNETGGEGVLEGETRTDEAGRALLQLPLEALKTEEPFTDFRYTVYVTVEATGYQFAEGQANFLATQGDWQIGAWCEPSFVRPEETVTANAKVLHWDTKKPIPNAVVQWRAGVVEWRGDEEQVQWRYRGQSQTNAKGEAQWQFAPVESGEWKVEALVTDQKGNLIGAIAYLWVTPQKGFFPAPPQAPPLQLRLDKPTYRVGETAKLIVHSKVPDAAVLLTLEGERLRSAQVLRLRNGMAEWQFPLSPILLPNAYVSAALVWNKRLAQQTQPVLFHLDAYRLQVVVRSDKPQYEPREPAQLTVQVRDEGGKPVRAELSLAVVDEAIYAIREDDPESVFRAFYAARPNQVLTRYSFPWLAWQGDKGEAETVRRYFPDTALWIAHLVTDEKGEATVKLTVPDTLTQWRVTAIAHTADTRIGFGIARFRCTKPFGVRLALPSVLTQGDHTTARAIVHNGTDAPLTAEVRISVRSPDGKATLTDLVAEPLVQTVTVAPNKTASVQWQFNASKSGKLVVRVTAKTAQGHRDAEERNITVMPHATERIVTRTVFLAPTETERKVLLVLPPNADLTATRLEVRLAPSVFSALLGALEYLATYPYGCVEQTMNSFLPDLMVWQLLRGRQMRLPWLERELPRMVERGLTRLYRFQHEDGGWGWWEEDPTDLWMTALVVRGLAEAKRAGFPVSQHALARGVQALQRLLLQQGQKRDADAVAFALFALARSGQPFPQLFPPTLARPVSVPNPNARTALAELVERCTPYGLAFLCLALHEWKHPAAQAVAEQLLRKALPLQEGLQWGAQGDRFDRRTSWVLDEEVTAWVLLALMRTNQVSPIAAAETVKTLLQRRRGVGWLSTKDTAAILEALLEFSRRYELRQQKAPLTVELHLNGIVRSLSLPSEAIIQPEQTVALSEALQLGTNEVRFIKPAGSSLWATVVCRQALTLPERTGEVVTGHKAVERRYERLLPRVEEGALIWQARPLQDNDVVRVGDLVRVTVTVNCSNEFMVLEDPLPAGFAPVVREEMEREEAAVEGMRPKEVRDDRTVTFFRFAGKYRVRYLLRAEVPGEYHILPPRLWHMYGTDRWLGAEARLSVRP